MLRDAVQECREALERGGIENSGYEARCMIEHLTGYSRAAQLAHAGEPFDRREELERMIQRRLRHEPLQYILGSWTFCGFPFSVGEGVLIPRDDTEVVLGLCLDYLKSKPHAKALDLCAGSGAIAVALSKLSDCEMTAVELSEKAFYFLRKNIEDNQAAVTPVRGDIFRCHNDFPDGCFDLIVSNPPYIRRSELPDLQAEVHFEPAMALDGGESGYDFYETIIRDWSGKLRSGGCLAFELGEEQAEYVSRLMEARGFTNIRTENDFGGIQRAIIGTLL